MKRFTCTVAALIVALGLNSTASAKGTVTSKSNTVAKVNVNVGKANVGVKVNVGANKVQVNKVTTTTKTTIAKGEIKPGTKIFTSPQHFHSHFRGHFHHRNYHGWSRYCYFGRHGCYGFFCPTNARWYYYYETGNCYLPISYLPTYAPVSSGAGIINDINASPIQGGTIEPELPEGATPIEGIPQQ